MAEDPPKDLYACPVCGQRHRAGTLVGFTNLNRKCAGIWNRRILRQRHARDGA